MSDDDLLALIEQWEALAEQAREQARLADARDISRAAFYQGVLKTYQSAAQDVRDLLTPQPQPAAAAPEYVPLSESEAAAILQRAGLFARSVTLHPDHVFSVVFSRLQPITQETRLQQLRAADPRLVIVDQGTLRDTGDPYIDFAFV
ncbi:MAG: hypothetical protein GC204_07000 [Chloroflexi bacterium]|nr:hypothetical protein [Chloroflexota bacterium]